MPLKDVRVVIDIRKAARLTGLGKPLILAQKTGDSTFTNFSEITDVRTFLGANTKGIAIAEALLNQGDTSPAVIAIATYDPEGTVKTPQAALELHFEEDFYFITEDSQVLANVQAVANVVEGKGFKIFGTTLPLMASLNTLSTLKFDRTFAMLHETVNEYPAEGLIGGNGSKTTGSITYKNKRIVGITPQDFNAAKISDIETLNGFAFVAKSGYNVTSEGTVLSGEYIDVIHSKDWVVVNITNAIQELLITNDKIPYTDAGISLLTSAVENVLLTAFAQGIISATDGVPDYTITSLSRAETAPADRAAREYKGLSFSFGLAGAIHTADITGEIVI